MTNKIFTLVASLAVFTSASTAQAQYDDVKRTVTLTYTGTVTDDVRNTIRILQPDGSTSPFIGEVPDYPYSKGDQVTISFDAVVPTSAYYDRYVGQQSADGMYEFNVFGPRNSRGDDWAFDPITGLGGTQEFDVTGPIRQDIGNGERLFTQGITILYNANTDTYSVKANANWLAGNFDAPAYLYDVATNSLRLVATACITYGQCENAGLVWRGNSDGTVSLGGRSYMGIGIPVGTSNQPVRTGLFDFSLAGGSWSVGGLTSGGATPVPEPSVVILFGSAAAGLMFARRRRKRG